MKRRRTAVEIQLHESIADKLIDWVEYQIYMRALVRAVGGLAGAEVLYHAPEAMR